MELWSEWWIQVSQLRSGFSRQRTFVWFAVALAAISVRSDLLGVTRAPTTTASPGSSSFGHSCQAVGLIVRAAASFLAVPLSRRIHEGAIFTSRDRRSLLERCK